MADLPEISKSETDSLHLIAELTTHIRRMEKHLTPKGRAVFGLCTIEQAAEESKEHHEIRIVRKEPQ